MTRTLTSLTLLLTLIAAPFRSAHAEQLQKQATVETRFALAVRGEPSLAAKVLERLPSSMRLKMLGRSADGNWTRVRSQGAAGWVQTNELKVGFVGEKK